MSKAIKPKDLYIKIYCEDTDFQGFVYHANYLKYFERSRTEFLIDNDINQNHLLEQNQAFVVRAIQMKYLAPAKLEDEIVIKTEVQKTYPFTIPHLRCMEAGQQMHNILLPLLQ